MRRVLLVLLVGVLWFGAGGATAIADGMILPEIASPDYLIVRYHHVTVTIEDGHAVTRVEQEFHNPHDFRVEGRYLFPVPPDAIVSRFQAELDGRRQQVTHQDPATTNESLYETLIRRNDPSLLQYADWESLAFDLSIPPNSSRRMTLEYEEVLAPAGGLYRYRYILSTERYSSQLLEDASVIVDIRSTSGLSSLYSSSHAVVTERLGPGRARVTWAASDVRPTEDFELFFAPANGGFGAGLLTGKGNDHDHFLFIFSPEVELHSDDYLPKDIVFILDRSGSMAGEKLDQARNGLHFILDQLGENDRFSIVSFNDEISVLADTLQPAGTRALKDARRYVDRLSADHNTDLEAALQTGLEILARSGDRGAPRMVVFLTDGLPTAGIVDETLIGRSVTDANAELRARLHVFGVGYDVNTHLLDRLAGDNHGSVTYVQPGENLEMRLTEFYGRIAHPILTDVEVEFEGVEASDLYPQNLPDLFHGSSLLLAGRYHASGDDITVRVSGRAGEEVREFAYQFDLERAGGNDFVARLWATRRIGALLDEVRVRGETQDLVAEISDLGTAYGVATPYTTFVIESQLDGVTSAENMSLYKREDLNQAWGETTIQARVQNQAYQQATRASLASGANVVRAGGRYLAQMGNQYVDLSLLDRESVLDGVIDVEWINRTAGIDRIVEFGSEEYFALARDSAARSYLQSGPNVIFVYEGMVIQVHDGESQILEPAGGSASGAISAEQAPMDYDVPSMNLASSAVELLLSLLRTLVP